VSSERTGVSHAKTFFEPLHIENRLRLAQAQYPEPTGTSRLFMVESQRNHLSTKNVPSRFPFSLTLNKQDTALVKEYLIRRKKNMILNGINEVSKETGIH
jgi:hypothetical protein